MTEEQYKIGETKFAGYSSGKDKKIMKYHCEPKTNGCTGCHFHPDKIIDGCHGHSTQCENVILIKKESEKI